ncbi:hypothetical protein AB0K16_48360 [Nonomuraea jabiensis]|uniref:hypothetical protein n=1 Tax=Nonomuraea jabiensis TaxID=882448 RepID=UPI003431559B
MEREDLPGFQPDARLLIVNSDDFGMHRAVNGAVARSIDEGIPGSILWPQMR